MTRAGTASALNGFLMMVGAFGMGHWLGRHMDDPLRALATGMGVWTTLIALVAWTAVQRYATPAPTLQAPRQGGSA